MRFNTISAALALGLLGTGLALPQQPVPAVAPPPQGPVAPAPGVQVPSEKAPTAQDPTVQGPIEKASTEKAPTDKAAVEKAPIEKAPTEKAAVEKAPTEKAAVEKAPTEKAPTEKAAVEKAPTEKAAVEEAPIEKAPTNDANSANAVEQIKKINSNLLDASKLLKEVETEDLVIKAFLTQAARFVDALASGVQLTTFTTATKEAVVKEPAVKAPAENKLAEKEPAIAEGIFSGEKGGDVYLDVGKTEGPVDNSVKGVDATVKSTAKTETANRNLKDIEAEPLGLPDAGKTTSAYDPEWEYEARELLKLLQEE